MKPVEYGVDISLKAGAAIENLKAKTMNCTPYAFGGANGYDDLPTNPVLGQMFHSSIDDRYYRWGIDRDNDITASLSYRWAPVADVVSEFAFDELSSPTNGVGYYRYNVTANEASVRQAFEDISAIGAAFFDMSSLRTLNLNDFTTPYEIQVVNQQGYTVTQPQIQPYVVNNPYAPRVIRVKNPDNQNPTLYNDTIPVVTGDILLPKYRADNGSWTYEVVRRYQDGGAINGKLKVNGLDISKSHYGVLEAGFYGTTTTGFKINTKIPCNGSVTSMYTLKIKGYSFGTSEVIDLSVCFYSYLGNVYNAGFSMGNHSFVPNVIKVASEDGYIVILIEAQIYYPHIIIDVFEGQLGGSQSYLEGWTCTDAPLTSGATNITLLDVRFLDNSRFNRFKLGGLTTTEINAISSPTTGLQVYNLTLNTMCFYNGSSWQKVTSSAM